MTSIEQSAAAMARYVAELEKEVQALRADALRYRWLRDCDTDQFQPFADWQRGPATSQWDAAIDAAMGGRERE